MKNDNELLFSDESHTYSWRGIVIPSVTQVLVSAGFIPISCMDEEAAERGSVVHRICQLDDEGSLERYHVHKDATPFLEAYRRFKKDVGLECLEIEQPKFSRRHRYAGTPDRDGHTPPSKGKRKKTNVIIDIKTSAAIQGWHRYQLAAYAKLGFPAGIRRIIVRLNPSKGLPGYFINEFPVSELRTDFNVFLSALSTYNAKK